MTPSTNRAEHEQHAADRRRLGQHRRAARAPNAVWLPPPPNALAMSPPLPCWSSTTSSSSKTDERRKDVDQVIEHNVLIMKPRLYRPDGFAPRCRRTPDVEAGAADQRAVDVGQRDQLAMLSGLTLPP